MVFPKWVLMLLLVGLVACDEDVFDRTTSFEVTKGSFSMRIPFEGEMEASVETLISMPREIMRPQALAWLAEENSLVKKGEVIARFDATQFTYNSTQEVLRKKQIDIDFVVKENTLSDEMNKIDDDLNLISRELLLADQFAMEDLAVFSKNEVIDSMRDREYLEARQSHTEWRSDVHDDKSSSELQLLNLKREKHENKLTMYADALGEMDVVAPHDGIFILKKNRFREKVRVGDIIYPGWSIAALPDTSTLQAKVNVLESEAAGLEAGLRVEFFLDAYPDEVIEGVVVKVGNIARPIERDSPVKYFSAEVEVTSDPKPHWRPGNKLQGRIFVLEKTNVISVPSQAVYLEEGRPYVFLNHKNQWIKQQVEIGSRSLSLTEIKSGIKEGDVVALYKPEGVIADA